MASHVLTLHAASVAELLDHVRDVRKTWNPGGVATEEIWFRGQRRSQWQLHPGLYRPHEATKEYDDETLLEVFKALGARYSHANSDDWHWYFLAQHYGLPTRLLDWTENALMGVFFAIYQTVEKMGKPEVESRLKKPSAKPDFGDEAPCVWILDAGTLNQVALGDHCDNVLSLGGRLSEYYLPQETSEGDVKTFKVESGHKVTNKYPIAVLPSWGNVRLVAQQGMFTIHGVDRRPLDDIARGGKRPRLAKVILDRSRVANHWDDLATAGVNWHTVFPDLDHLATHICWMYDNRKSS